MPFQSVPLCAEAVIQGTYDDKPIANVLNFFHTGGYEAEDLVNLAEAVDAAVGAHYVGIMNSSVNYVQTLVKGLEFINDREATSFAHSSGGTASGNPLPANVTLCYTFRSTYTGRSARGRMYSFPSATSALSAANEFTTTYQNAYGAFVEAFQGNALAAGWNHVIVSRITGGTVRPLGTYFLVSSSQIRNGTADSQRGRLPKGH